MTLLDELIDLDAISGIDDDQGGAHVACCVADPKRFVCGAPYHPEFEADMERPDDDPEDRCPTCVRRLQDFQCGGGLATHTHCPLDPTGQTRCPRSPKRRKPT